MRVPGLVDVAAFCASFAVGMGLFALIDVWAIPVVGVLIVGVLWVTR